MGIRVTYYENPHASIRELLDSNYAPFRKWVIEDGGRDDRDFPYTIDAQNRVVELLMKNEQLPSFETMDQGMADQFTLFMLTTHWTQNQKKVSLFNEIESEYLMPEFYIAACKRIDATGNKTASRLWKYIVEGRSVAASDSFLKPYKFTSSRFSYWTPTECMLMETILRDIKEPPYAKQALFTIRDILRKKNKQTNPGELIILGNAISVLK